MELIAVIMFAVIGIYVMYHVIRAGVRDGIRAAREDGAVIEHPKEMGQP